MVRAPVADSCESDTSGFANSTRAANFEGVNLIDKLLSEQRELTAVDRFSQKHAGMKGNALESHYQDLIPIRKPSTGEQYAFEVDLDHCTGCKSCVVACHSMNGLHEKESWRDIGSIRGIVDGKPRQQTVTSACHHCADPGCLNGCPVGAYEKQVDTGIVRHLDDQCIGCQYCSLKCPYDVPKYDASLGIVRKCDMCHERLADGEAPACVQACPNGAIKIKLVSYEEVNEAAKGGRQMLPGAFKSEYTKPTTTFRSQRELDQNMRASDEYDLEPAHSHLPLVTMLTLTQVSVGLSLLDCIGRFVASDRFAGLHLPLLVMAAVFGLAGLVASFTHLGSPAGAWRCFLGLKKSWLSREVIVFSLWMLALLGALVCSLPESWLGILPFALSDGLVLGSSVSAALLGVIAVFCSVMVYVDTRRDFWSMGKTLGRFGGTMMLGGFVGLMMIELYFLDGASVFSIVGAGLFLLFKMAMEISQLLPARAEEWSYAKKSALMQLKPLARVLAMRWVVLGVSFIMGVIACIVGGHVVLAAGATYVLLLVGEWLERRLFFQAVVTLKMPGEHHRVS